MEQFKVDLRPMNEDQKAVMKTIFKMCKDCADDIYTLMKRCPGLYEKNCRVEITVNPNGARFVREIKIVRNRATCGTEITERLHTYRGANEYDEGWQKFDILTTKELAWLFDDETDGTGET